jgi:hypothetical protein
MPGGANGWTDVYIYHGYWDKGTDNKCMSGDLYPILADIESADAQIRSGAPFTMSFGGRHLKATLCSLFFRRGTSHIPRDTKESVRKQLL